MLDLFTHLAYLCRSFFHQWVVKLMGNFARLLLALPDIFIIFWSCEFSWWNFFKDLWGCLVWIRIRIGKATVSVLPWGLCEESLLPWNTFFESFPDLDCFPHWIRCVCCWENWVLCQNVCFLVLLYHFILWKYWNVRSMCGVLSLLWRFVWRNVGNRVTIKAKYWSLCQRFSVLKF